MASLSSYSVTPLANGKFRVEAIVIDDDMTEIDLTGINAITVPDDLDELMTSEELLQVYDSVGQQALFKKAGVE